MSFMEDRRMHQADKARAKARQCRYVNMFVSQFDFDGWLQTLEVYYSPQGYLTEYMYMSIFEDVFGVVGKESTDVAAEDSGFEKAYPILFQMLTGTPMINGKRRKTCTMTQVCEDGMWKLGLRDRDRDVSLWVSGETNGKAMAALEEALTARPVAWRRLPDSGQFRGRK